ncbi:MAG: septum formation initiator family protein [Thermaerobacter sp.]|nr:septum formation initiator family protein [Thermaerobacter sp.]
MTGRVRGVRFGRLFLLVLFLYLGGLFIHARLVMWGLGRDLQTARVQVTRLEAANRSLHHRIARLQQDAYVARLAEERLGLVKPGEVPYIVRH